MNKLLSTEAAELMRNGNYEAAINKYKLLKKKTQLNIWDFDIKRAEKKLKSLSETSPDLGRVLSDSLGIENIYVINLKRRLDRKIRMLREFDRQNLKVEFVEGVDAVHSTEANDLYEQYKKRPVSESNVSTRHISKDIQNWYKKELRPGVFGYLLSQKIIIEDAKKRNYRKILVLDDDVFFSTDASLRLRQIAGELSGKWKVLMLGASEYADKSSRDFIEAQYIKSLNLYYPLGGKTCGSFAVAYDAEVFDDLLAAINEFDGPYDNAVLGSIFKRFNKECFVIDPAVVIPDVSDSDIRCDSRLQYEHGKKMNWEFKRFEEFNKPITVTIMVADLKSLKYIEKFEPVVANCLNATFYYMSVDGPRPVIAGHIFTRNDECTFPIAINQAMDIRDQFAGSGVPFSDIALLWPPDEELSEFSIRNVCSEVLKMKQEDGIEYGNVGEIKFCLNAGRKCKKGVHSIVISCFRSAEYVWPSVLSALMQKEKEIEVIVVNDNPTGNDFESVIYGKAEECRTKWNDGTNNKTLKVINHKKNRNASSARNTGFFQSIGEYISFLDDDDIYEPYRISEVDKLISTTHQNVGACYCGYTGNWNGKKNDNRFVDGNLLEKVLTLKYADHYLCTNTVTYKRSCFAQLGGFNESYRRHQDLEINVRYFERFNIVSVNKYCVKNRPSPVPETYTGNVHALCRLKKQFLEDFSELISGLDEKIRTEILEAHVQDILKRSPDGTEREKEIIKVFLGDALR